MTENLEGEEPRITLLSLKRKYGESIQIEGPAVVTVAEAKGRCVLVTIQARDGDRIRRMELVPEEEMLATPPSRDKTEAEETKVPTATPAKMQPFRMSGIAVPGHKLG